MTLRKVIEELQELSDDLVIFATKGEEWQLDSPAALVFTDDLQALGTQMEGLSYFLEVELAKEVLSVWQEWRNGRQPTEAEAIEAILYYADNDAYLNLGV